MSTLPPTIESVRDYIRTSWDATLRTMDAPDGECQPLPKAFIVPCKKEQFTKLFYWDAYYACEGLIAEGRVQDAINQAENFRFIVEHYKHIPNVYAHGKMFRSQPPHYALLVWRIFEETGDKEFLWEHLPFLETEWAFWLEMRKTNTGLNRYFHHATPAQLDNFYWVVRQRLNVPDSQPDRYAFLAHAIAEAEGGGDFSPRYNRRCGDFNPVDLNAFLFAHENVLRDINRETGNDNHANYWKQFADERRVRYHGLLWDNQRQFFFDYDFKNKKLSPLRTAAAFTALRVGVASREQARHMVDNLSAVEFEHGLATAEKNVASQTYQWNYPNMWPSDVLNAVKGLIRYEFKDHAQRIALKYVDTVTKNFTKTGDLWEKYNAVSGGLDVGDEYEMPAMLGWTAGVYLYCLKVLEETGYQFPQAQDASNKAE